MALPPILVPRPALRSGALLAAFVLGTATLVGCGGEDAPATTPTTSTTPISELRTAEMTVVRVEFCDLVDKAAIRRALAGPIRSSSSWKNGDPVPGAGADDIGHEVGCAWSGAGGRAARAWVFARPVSASYAKSLVRAAADQPRCRKASGPAFGKPTLTQACTFPDKKIKGGRTRFRHAGLFGDTWLTCEVTGPAAKKNDVRSRAGSWCVAVATTLDTQN